MRRHENGSVVVDGIELDLVCGQFVVDSVDEEEPLLPVSAEEIGSDISVEFTEVLEVLKGFEDVAVEEKEIQIRDDLEVDGILEIIEVVVDAERVGVLGEFVQLQKGT